MWREQVPQLTGCAAPFWAAASWDPVLYRTARLWWEGPSFWKRCQEQCVAQPGNPRLTRALGQHAQGPREGLVLLCCTSRLLTPWELLLISSLLKADSMIWFPRADPCSKLSWAAGVRLLPVCAHEDVTTGKRKKTVFPLYFSGCLTSFHERLETLNLWKQSFVTGGKVQERSANAWLGSGRQLSEAAALNVFLLVSAVSCSSFWKIGPETHSSGPKPFFQVHWSYGKDIVIYPCKYFLTATYTPVAVTSSRHLPRSFREKPQPFREKHW